VANPGPSDNFYFFLPLATDSMVANLASIPALFVMLLTFLRQQLTITNEYGGPRSQHPKVWENGLSTASSATVYPTLVPTTTLGPDDDTSQPKFKATTLVCVLTWHHR
jgi:hypothetical protein